MMKSPEAAALRLTSKGQLKYDSYWHLTHFDKTIAECTKPPVIRKLVVPNKADSNRQRSVEVNRQNITVSFQCTPVHKQKVKDNNVASDVVPNTADNRRQRSVDFDRKSVTESFPRIPVYTQKVKDNNIASDVGRQNEGKSRRAKEKNNQKLNACPKENRRKVIVDDAHTIALSLMDMELEDRKQNAKERKRKEYEQGFHVAQVNAETQWFEVSTYKEREQEQSHLELEADISDRARKTDRYLRQREEIIVHRQQLQDAQLQEAQLQNQIREKRQQNMLEELQTKINRIKSIEKDLIIRQNKVKNLISSCPYGQYIPENTKKADELFNAMILKVQKVVKESHNITDIASSLSLAMKIDSEGDRVVKVVENAVDAANDKGKEDQAAREAAEKAAREAIAKAEKPVVKVEALSKPVQVSDETPPDTDLVCMPQSFIEYQRLQDLAKQAEQTCHGLMTDPQYKKYRFTLQKAVNTPINAISPNSGAHLRDKLQKICKLLSGQEVEVGGQKISASQHPAGVTFCKHLFAKRIVKQGDEQVSGNQDSAFAIAAVTVGVMTQFEDVVDLVISEFHKQCPFLVPYYIQKQENQELNDYLKTLGYNFEEGVVEKQDKYLRRMTGIMRLYAAVLISEPPQGPNHPHPHGLDKAWTWLTCLLNLKPQPDITATMLHTFLQVTGAMFIKMYKKQFVKLLRSVKDNFMPKLMAAGSGGPVVRLQTYMEECVRSGTAPQPTGLLPTNFWYM